MGRWSLEGVSKAVSEVEIMRSISGSFGRLGIGRALHKNV